MDDSNDNKFILINTQITIFENIIKELKEKINNNIKYKNEIKIYSRKLYSKELEKYDKLIIHIMYNKIIKSIKEFSFSIIINDSFPKTPPIIICNSLDININLNDRRDLFYSIMEGKWNLDSINNNSINILVNLILIRIPNFILRLLYYEEKKILIYYGKYYINEIYNINNFIINKNIKLFKVMTYNKEKENYIEQNIKYIIITDIYILFFDTIEDKPKNLGKLIFIGEIFQNNNIERLDIDINSNIKEQNNIFNFETHKIYIDWIINEKNYSFIFSIINEINVIEKKNLIKNNYSYNNDEIVDFMDIVNKKQNFISTQYKLVINDYNQLESLNSLIESQESYSNKILNDLIQLSKFLEKSQKKVNIKNENENEKINDLYNKEIYKIYNKVVDISTKINKIEILYDYLDKLEIINKKRIISNNYIDIDSESNSDEEENKEEEIKINNIINEKKENILIKNKSNNKSNVFNMINKINKNNDEQKNNVKENNYVKSNSICIKNKINNIELNISKNNKKDIDKNKNININNTNNKKNSISSLIKMYEKKKD